MTLRGISGLSVPERWFSKLPLEVKPVCALNRCQNFGNILSRLLSDPWKPVFIASSGEYYTLQRTTHIYYFCVYIKSFPFYLYKKSDYALSSIYAFFQLVHWIEMSVCTSLGLVGLTLLGRPGEIFLKFFSLVRKIVWILKGENITCLKYKFSWIACRISNVPCARVIKMTSLALFIAVAFSHFHTVAFTSWRLFLFTFLLFCHFCNYSRVKY